MHAKGCDEIQPVADDIPLLSQWIKKSKFEDLDFFRETFSTFYNLILEFVLFFRKDFSNF